MHPDPLHHHRLWVAFFCSRLSQLLYCTLVGMVWVVATVFKGIVKSCEDPKRIDVGRRAVIIDLFVVRACALASVGNSDSNIRSTIYSCAMLKAAFVNIVVVVIDVVVHLRV